MTEPEQTSPEPFEVAEEPGPDRRRLAIIGGAAAVVLAGVGYFLIGGGGGSGADVASVVPSSRHLGTSGGTVSNPRGPKVVLPPPSTVKLGRDPFHALYVVPAAPVAAGPGQPATGSGTPGGTTGGTTKGGGTTGGTPAPAPKPVPTTYALKLSRVDGSGSNLTARFLIGAAGKIQFARAGSVFGRSAEIRLLSLQKGANGAGTAVIQIGDSSPFDISTKDAAIFVQ